MSSLSVGYHTNSMRVVATQINTPHSLHSLFHHIAVATMLQMGTDGKTKSQESMLQVA